MRELSPGRVVAGFVIKERLGKGGMGEVFLVHDQKLRVDRALKVISGSDDLNGQAAQVKQARERFLREARTLARLRHPNIIPVHEIGEMGGSPFLVMSYFAARDGRKWIRQESPDAERLRRIALQVANALAHAHESGVLHRDIKQSNMLIGKDDEVMLIDFGLAKSKTDANVTRTGRAMGTYNYLAPEYVAASRDHRGEHTVLTDLWALGCLLYAFTCRRPAFEAENDIKLLDLIEHARFTPVKTARPDVPDAWAKFIHDLMEPDPAKRIPSARIAAQRLEALSLTPAPISPLALSAMPAAPLAPAAEIPPPAGGLVEANAAAPKTPADSQTVAASATPVAREESSLFDHQSRKREETAPTAQLAQPSFQAPAEPQSNAKARAKRSLLLPLAAALAVLGIGGTLIVWADSAAKGRSRSKNAAYVDPDELKRQERAQQELEALDVERTRRAPAPVPRERQSSFFPIVVPTNAPVDSTPPPPEAPISTPSRSSNHRTRIAEKPKAPLTDDPWARRYGTRKSFNSSVAPADAGGSTVASTAAPIAGVKIPVRVRDAIASAPAGPVIAIVEAPTKVGDIELPKNAELHGRTIGPSGPRILVEFTFAIVNGRNVPLKGSALGSDGRSGVPGAKSVGGVSDVAAGGAGGAVQGLVDLAAGATDNPLAQGIIRGGGAPTVNKATVIDNEEQLVVTNRGVRFAVYVESLSS